MEPSSTSSERDAAQPLDPHAAVTQFVRRLVAREAVHEGPERRSDPRYVVTIKATVQPLNDAHRPMSDAFVVTTFNISLRGIAFFHTRQVCNRLVSVQLTNPQGETVTTVVQVIRCTPRGPLYEISGKFVGRL